MRSRAKRILHLMNPDEVAELAAQSVDFQLHTHRHSNPQDAESLSREIRDNRSRIERLTRLPALHFCYPSGHYESALLPWLESERVVSATTCDPALYPQSAPTSPSLADAQVSAAQFRGG
jgi:peptidoglycan/xylan/chitin deacetylase (PgdA/CDA1 family)